MFYCSIGVGDGGRAGARAPPPKIREKNFSGNYYEKFGHFSGENHVKFGHFVMFLYIFFGQKCRAPLKLTELLRLCIAEQMVALVPPALHSSSIINHHVSRPLSLSPSPGVDVF